MRQMRNSFKILVGKPEEATWKCLALMGG